MVVYVACICLGFFVVADLALADHHGDYPVPSETILLALTDKLASHDSGGAFPNHWVSSPPCPLVVRQQHPAGPRYQEILGYTFLIHSMKRPRLVRMDSGRLLLAATAWLDRNDDEEPIILHSDDEGQSWSSPRGISIHGTLVNLGDAKAMIFSTSKTIFSDDAGETWSTPTAFASLPDHGVCHHHGSVQVDGQTVSAICFVRDPGYAKWVFDPEEPWGDHSLFWQSHDSGHTWGKPLFFPKDWQTNEGSLTRAADGALVAAMRTRQPDGFPSYADHWRRITTARSTDNGKTWTDRQLHFNVGKVHSELLTLANGDILLTYAARMGNLDGHLYHGVEAVLSHDHGKTWAWDHRFILFRWPMHQTTHSPASVQLSDGRILTVFLYHYDAPWGKGTHGMTNLGMCDVVIWDPSGGDDRTK